MRCPAKKVSSCARARELLEAEKNIEKPQDKRAQITKRNRRMNEIEKKENKLILYKDEEGKLSVNTLFADEELDKDVVVRKFRHTTQHGAIEG